MNNQNQATQTQGNPEPEKFTGDVVDGNGQPVYEETFMDKVIGFIDRIPKPVKMVIGGAALLSAGAGIGIVGMKIHEKRKGSSEEPDNPFWNDDVDELSGDDSTGIEEHDSISFDGAPAFDKEAVE